MGNVKKYKPLHEMESAIDMRPSDALEELHNVVKMIYSDTTRVLNAINAELSVYNSMIERAETQAARDKLRLKQAQAAQKRAVDPRMVESLGNVIAQMREIATECNGGAEISFINDFELPDSDSHPVSYPALEESSVEDDERRVERDKKRISKFKGSAYRVHQDS